MFSSSEVVLRTARFGHLSSSIKKLHSLTIERKPLKSKYCEWTLVDGCDWYSDARNCTVGAASPSTPWKGFRLQCNLLQICMPPWSFDQLESCRQRHIDEALRCWVCCRLLVTCSVKQVGISILWIPVPLFRLASSNRAWGHKGTNRFYPHSCVCERRTMYHTHTHTQKYCTHRF